MTVSMESKKKNYDSEDGMIVVEAVITLTVFLMVIALISYLITIYTVHNKIQFAINSAAHEVATYSYLYQVTGLRNADLGFRNDGSEYVGNINDTTAQVLDSIGKIEELAQGVSESAGMLSGFSLSESDINTLYNQANNLSGTFNEAYDSTEQSVEDVVNLLSDPQHLAAGGIYGLLEEGEAALKGAAGAGIAMAVTRKYLGSTAEEADEYCLNHGIVGGYSGLNFWGSSLFLDGTQGFDYQGLRGDGEYRMIDIVVTYKIDLGFARIVLPPDKAYLTVVQRVTVPAWTNGDGREPENYHITILGKEPENSSNGSSGDGSESGGGNGN